MISETSSRKIVIARKQPLRVAAARAAARATAWASDRSPDRAGDCIVGAQEVSL